MTIDNISGGGFQTFSLEGGQGTSSVSNNGSPVALPSYLSASDLDFSASATGVLGIRMPMGGGAVSDELLMALLENEEQLRNSKGLGALSLSGRISAALGENAQATDQLGTLLTSVELAEAQKELLLEQQAGAQATLTEQTANQSSLAGQIDDIEAEITNLNGQLAPLNSQITGLNGAITTANNQIATIDGQIATIDSDIAALEGQPGDHSGEIADLQGQRAVLVADRGVAVSQRDTKVSQRDTAIGQRDTITAERDGKVATRDGLVAQKQAVDSDIAGLNAFIASSETAIADKDTELVGLEEQHTEIIAAKELQLAIAASAEREKKSSSAAASEEDLKNADRLREMMKELLKGAPLQFWSETNRERIMKTERTQESKDPSEGAIGQFAAFAIARSIPGESLGNPTAVTSRDLDAMSADRAYEATFELVSGIADALKAVDELVNQPAPQRDVQQGRVLLSLT